MSRVDYFALPPRAELGDELLQAFRELNLDDVEETEPVDDDALLGVTFSDDVPAAEVEDRAENLRTALAALLTGGPEVSFKLITG